MRLQRLEKEEQRVRRAIEEKEEREREEDKDKMDIDQTPPAAELKAAEKELGCNPALKRPNSACLVPSLCPFLSFSTYSYEPTS
jgi:hypothetical protein